MLLADSTAETLSTPLWLCFPGVEKVHGHHMCNACVGPALYELQ